MSEASPLLVYAMVCSFFTLLAIKPMPRLPGVLLVPIFLLTLPVTELTIYVLVCESIGAIWFIGTGALSEPYGHWAFALFCLNIAGLVWLFRCQWVTGSILEQALEQAGISRDNQADRPLRVRDWLLPKPICPKTVETLKDIAYADSHPLQTLDIYRAKKSSKVARPVLLFIHGGGWYLGDKSDQGLPLLHFMADQGWLCVSINYRLAPDNRLPAHIIDVKHAIQWIKKNIAEYGGDPNFIAAAGGSAGGHLSALAALTGGKDRLRERFQPGFETADTEIQAAVSLYGMYDFVDSSGLNINTVMRKLLEDKIMPKPLHDDPELWRDVSPLSNVHEDAPPHLIIHGSHDPMMSPADSTHFSTSLQAVSASSVAIAILPGAQHAFDLLPSLRTAMTVRKILQFLNAVRAAASESAPRQTGPSTTGAERINPIHSKNN